ncbi:MAG TPA: acyl-CoA dehydrogenase family protein [Stellaceae bacterium]|jgi:alkylation response protein AidB-like acyl-CoA dehydrogenase
MDEQLTEEQRQLRESAAKLCADCGGARRARDLREAGQDIDTAAWRAIVEAGWLGMMVPERHGGLGLGAVEFFIVLEQAGRQALTTPLLEQVATAWLFGALGQPPAALGAMLDGARIIVPSLDADGWTFRRGGSLLTRVPVFATAAHDFLVEDDNVLALLAHPSHGLSLTVHVDGSRSARITSSDAAVVVARGAEATALAAKLGDLLALGSAIELLGLCESAMTLALEHVKTRKQFGQPLGSFQALQHRLADNFVDLELNRSLLHRICVAWDQGTAQPAMIAGAKARAVRVTTEIMRNALQLHGAIGYTDEHDIGVLWKHALALSARYGNELTQAARFARLTAEEG